MENKLNVNAKKSISAASLLIALGIIYGDIGTSPLYTLRAVIGDRNITEILVLGGVSCIFWTLVIQTTIKYVWLTLKADNFGEGGIFSLYALVSKYGKWLAIPTILGATTLLADGIITPPISVASAIEGLTMVKYFEHIHTVPIVIAILSILFFFQRFGTHRVGAVFGPIMVLWFSMLLIIGAKEILIFPSILKALNPYYAYELLVNYPHGFWLLGAVFLCTTGAEALYSDLGHCGKTNIRITWLFVKICLVASYLGQAAWVMNQGQPLLNGRNPFFEIIPSWFLLPSIILATVATIIASQALITGSYTLISEAMNLNFWPRVTVSQPSESKGQVYIPSVNNILWFGCVLMILYFQTSAHMEAAYGFSITIAMMMTTLLLAYFLIFVLKWNKWAVASLLILFTCVEVAFFIANVAKIKERWMFLFFELGIFLTMYVWYAARGINNKFTKFVDLGKHVPALKDLSEDISINYYATHLIYLSKANKRNEIEEKIIKSIFSKQPKKASIYWFIHINRTDQPYTLSYDVTELVEDKVIKINLNVGFKIRLRTELYFKRIVQELIQNKELNLHNIPFVATRYNCEPDLKFVVIEKYLSVENELTIRDSLILNAFFQIKKLGLSDEAAFGLDKSDVIVEKTPLVYQPVGKITLVRAPQSAL